jgi:hypothetical protein
MILLYILLGIIAVGVLLQTSQGREMLEILWLLFKFVFVFFVSAFYFLLVICLFLGLGLKTGIEI